MNNLTTCNIILFRFRRKKAKISAFQIEFLRTQPSYAIAQGSVRQHAPRSNYFYKTDQSWLRFALRKKRFSIEQLKDYFRPELAIHASHSFRLSTKNELRIDRVT